MHKTRVKIKAAENQKMRRFFVELKQMLTCPEPLFANNTCLPIEHCKFHVKCVKIRQIAYISSGTISGNSN
jgi:hypothetical protein